MKRLRIVLLVSVLAGHSAGVMAQPTTPIIDRQQGLTLEDAIAEGLRAEPGLRAMTFAADAARGEAQQTALRPNPAITFEQREQAGGPDRQTNIGFELPLDAFARGPRVEASQHMVAASGADLDDRRRLLGAAIRDQYGEVLAAARRLEVLDAVVAASRRTYELLRDRASEGATPPFERDVALVELRRLEGERDRADGRVTVAAARLKALLGRTPAAPLTLKDSLEGLIAERALSGDVRGDRADVREAAEELAAARARVREAQAQGKPEVMVFGSYMRMDASFPQQAYGVTGALEPIHGIFHNASAGVRVSLPVFNRAQGTAAAAKARELSASAVLDSRRLAAASDTAAATVRLEAARRALSRYEGDTLAVARRNVDVIRETFTLGRATLLDVLNEQRRYLEFESAYVDALAETFAAESDLTRARGEVK